MRGCIIPLITFLFCFFSSDAVWAQSCGCAAADNCPEWVNSGTSSTICYEVTDAFVDDLSLPGQGVCGVNLHFTNSNVGNHTITLCSPSGQCVQLTGSDETCNVPTIFGNWDILFVPCDSVPAPDTLTNCAYPGIWTNCPDNCAWANAFYDGSYQPYNGCLEDFNSGSVNGEWCVTLDNTNNPNGGQIVDFELIFCDESGFLCCDADAGAILTADVLGCEGDSSLIFEATPIYGATEPNPDDYGYLYLISSGNEIIAYESELDFTNYAVGVYEVCGLSFLHSDSTNIPAPNTGLNSQDLNDNLEGGSPLFCGDVSDNCFDVVIATPIPEQNIDTMICEGQCFMLGDSCFAENGSFSLTLTAFNTCDSIVNLNLTILNTDTTFLTESICTEESFMVGDSIYTETGIYETAVASSQSCDSIVILDLTVLLPFETTLIDSICVGDSFQVGNEFYTETGTYIDTLINSAGCDSIVSLDLTVISLVAEILSPDEINCLQSSVFLDGTNSSDGVGISQLWTSANGQITGAIDTLFTTVNAEGDYILTVTQASCTVADTIFVNEDTESPIADAGLSDTLNCAETIVTLDASNSTPAPNNTLTYFWVGQNNCSTSDPISATPTTSCADIYSVIIRNSENGCRDTAFVEIFEDLIPPIADAGQDTFLTCINSCIELNANQSQPIGNINFQWTTADGNIKNGATTPNPQVDSAGVYQILVTNPNNFCMDSATVNVSFDLVFPEIEILVNNSDTITCQDTIITLNANLLNVVQNPDFQWIGGVVAGQGTTVATVQEAGDYTIIVTDLDNGCVDTASIEIFEDIDLPFVNAEGILGTVLNCVNDTLLLGGNNNPTGTEFSYLWETTDGNIFPSTTILNPFTDTEGVYILTITNTTTGCAAVDTVVIESNVNFPIADILSDGTIDCVDTTFTLIAEESTGMSPWLYSWSVGGNVIEEGVGVSEITVDFPGVFHLEVTNIDGSFCTAIDSAEVILTAIFPVADAGPDVFLDCELSEAILNGTDTPINSNLIFQWIETGTNCIFENENSLQPSVNCEGMYLLEVTDISTNCVSVDTTFSFVDTSDCTPLVFAGLDTTITCLTGSMVMINVTVNGETMPDFDVFSYQWTDCDGGNINVLPEDILHPIFGEGCYILTVTNQNFNFTVSDTIEIIANNTPPIADAGPDLILNCPDLEVCQLIDGSMSSQGSQYTYLWETINGEICIDSTNLNSQIQGEGAYVLIVTDTISGCMASDGMTVSSLGDSPIANAGEMAQLECGIDTISLDGSGSFLPGNTEISWFSTTGTVVFGENTLFPIVENSGIIDTFFLTLFNPENLCRDTAFVEIFPASGCFPDCGLLPPMTLTCVIDTVCIDTIGTSVGSDICYQWTAVGGTGGPIVGSDTMATACVTVAGIYELAVTKKTNGAQFTTACQVQVMEEIIPPNADAGDPQFLTCADTCVTLDGSNSALNATYQWLTIDGNIKSGETSMEAEVNQIGTYTLVVTSLANGCTNSDNVMVGTDFTTPEIFNIPDEIIGCSGQAVLNATATTSGVTYQWTGPCILAGATSLSPIICQEGEYCLTVTDIGSGCTVTECTVVTPDGNLPTANVGEDIYSTCLQTEFNLEGEFTGQNVTFFEWTGPCILGNASQQNITVACPGIYTFTVTDINGCQGTDNIEVILDDIPPIADAGLNQTLTCDTLQLDLNATNSQSNSVNPLAGTLGFSWSTMNGQLCGGEMTATPTVCAGGTYSVTVTDLLTGCTAADLVEVTEQISIPQLQISEDTTLTCSRDTVVLSGIGSSTNFPFQHIWTTNNGSIKSNPDELEVCVDLDGIYFLTVRDTSNGCEIIDSVMVTMDTIAPIAIIETQNGLTVNCAIPTVTIDGSDSTPVGNIDFFWETMNGNILTGNENAAITVDSGGIYELQITNTRNGCVDLTSYTVTEDFAEPMLDFVPPPPITCVQTEVILEAIPPDNQPIYAFQWDGPVGSIEDEDTATPTVNQAVNYTVTITDESNGCTNSGSILVEQNLTPPVAEATTLGSLDCIQITAGISGAGSSTNDVTYLWTTPSIGNITDPTAIETVVNAPGWYFIEVTNIDNGCIAQDSTEVTASAIPIVDALISFDEPDCIDNQGFIHFDSLVGGIGPYLISMNGNPFTTFNQFNFLSAGTYDFQVEDSNGCTFDTTLILEPPSEIQVDLGLDLEVNFGDSTQLEALISVPFSDLDTIIWTPLLNPDCPNCLIQGIRPLETATYSVRVIDTDGCEDFDKVIVFVDERPHLFAPNIFSPNGDGENEWFYLQADETIRQIRQLLIFDRWGNMVFQGENFQPNIPNLGWDGLLSGETMNPQAFIWKAEAEFVDGRVEVVYGDFVLVR